MTACFCDVRAEPFRARVRDSEYHLALLPIGNLTDFVTLVVFTEFTCKVL